MKTKTVKQYICDFCGKKKYSAPAMVKHEKYCTMNPKRECRLCISLNGNQNDLDELKRVLVEPVFEKVPRPEILGGGEYEEIKNQEEVDASVKKMVAMCEGCSACALAAMRQMDICSYAFDYKEMNKIAISELNDMRMEQNKELSMNASSLFT